MPNLVRAAGRTGRQWRQLVDELRSLRLPCWICGHPIDYSLPFNHKRSFTVDHRVPLHVAPWLAEVPSNLAAAHRDCNSRKSNSVTLEPVATSRHW